MKKTERNEQDTLRPEYRRADLGKGVRGKFLADYRAGTNLVLLSPEVAAIFPDDAAVNQALLSLVKLAERAAGRAKRPAGRAPRAESK